MTIRERFNQWLDGVPASSLLSATPALAYEGLAFLSDADFEAQFGSEHRRDVSAADTLTHVVPSFTRRNELGWEETACSRFVSASRIARHGEAPTCPECASWCGW